MGNFSASGHSSHRVFDPAGISPTVMENHGFPVLILEPQATLTPLTSPTPTPTVFVSASGFSPSTPTPMNEDARLQVAATIDSGLTFAGTTRQDDKAYHPDGIAPAIAVCRSNHVPLITEPMNEEATIRQVAKLDTPGGWDNPQAGRVYDPDGVAPALPTTGGGCHEPRIILPLNALDGGDVAPTVCAHYHKASGEDFRPRSEGNPVPHCAIVEATPAGPAVIQPLTAALRGRPEASGGNAQHFELGGPVANALTHVQKDSLVAMPAGTVIANTQLNCYRGTVDDPAPCVCAAAGMGGGHVPMVTETADPAEPQPAPADGVCPGSELQLGEPSVKPAPSNAVLIDGVFYRVRKLTERECFRLMDVDDADIDRINAALLPAPTKADPAATKPISKTAKYKLAGNSIVVSCLYHIFRTMFLPNQPENATPTQPTQLSLFP